MLHELAIYRGTVYTYSLVSYSRAPLTEEARRIDAMEFSRSDIGHGRSISYCEIRQFVPFLPKTLIWVKAALAANPRGVVSVAPWTWQSNEHSDLNIDTILVNDVDILDPHVKHSSSGKWYVKNIRGEYFKSKTSRTYESAEAYVFSTRDRAMTNIQQQTDRVSAW